MRRASLRHHSLGGCSGPVSTTRVQVRAALEAVGLAHLAAQRRTTEEVTRLRELLATQQAAIDTGDRVTYTQADAELHRTVVACARNELLCEIYQHLGGALKPSFVPELWDQVLAFEEIDYHAVLIDAIAAGDPVAAEAAADALIEILKDALLPPDGRTQ